MADRIHRDKINLLLDELEKNTTLQQIFQDNTNLPAIVEELLKREWTLQDVHDILADNKLHKASKTEQRIWWFA